MLYRIYKRALKAGGANMPAAKYARVFGNDSTLRRNVLRACANPFYGAAIESGTVGDHRVFESLNRMGDLPARIVLDLETRLHRKLGRAKAQQLCACYSRIAADRLRASGGSRKVIRFHRVA